jgi:hypothetical protein
LRVVELTEKQEQWNANIKIAQEIQQQLIANILKANGIVHFTQIKPQKRVEF